MKKICFLWAALAAVVLGVAGCAQNPATGKMNLMLVDEETEFNIGHENVQRHIKTHGLYKENPALNDYYQKLAHNLVFVTERSDKPFEFIILDSDTFNAWAVPGYINMYRGLMPFFNSEAEFMTVLAHEAGHITARHTVRNQTKSTLAGLAIIAGSIAVGVNTNNDAAAAAVITGGMFASQIGFAKFSRLNEEEADALAMRYLQRLGYDVTQAENVFDMFLRYEQLSDTVYHYFYGNTQRPAPLFYDVLRSHPQSADRKAQAHKRAQAILAAANTASDIPPSEASSVAPSPKPNTPPVVAKVGRHVYLDMIDGMAFGPNFREYGVAGRNTLYNQRLKYRVNLPENFYIAFIDGGWRAYDNVSKTNVSLSVSRVDKTEDPEETLRIKHPKLRELQALSINGLKAYTGVQYIYEKTTFSKKLVGKQRIFGIKGGPSDNGATSASNFFELVFTTPDEATFTHMDAQFFKSAESFRGLSSKQAEALQPLRIKIIEVKPGDTFESLAEQLPFGDLRSLWFSALNNISPTTPLQVGTRLKTVVDPNQNLSL